MKNIAPAWLLALGLVAMTAPAPAKAPAIGDDAPNFTLEELRGGNSSLHDYSGKAVLIFFFGYS